MFSNISNWIIFWGAGQQLKVWDVNKNSIEIYDFNTQKLLYKTKIQEHFKAISMNGYLGLIGNRIVDLHTDVTLKELMDYYSYFSIDGNYLVGNNGNLVYSIKDNSQVLGLERIRASDKSEPFLKNYDNLEGDEVFSFKYWVNAGESKGLFYIKKESNEEVFATVNPDLGRGNQAHLSHDKKYVFINSEMNPEGVSITLKALMTSSIESIRRTYLFHSSYIEPKSEFETDKEYKARGRKVFTDKIKPAIEIETIKIESEINNQRKNRLSALDSLAVISKTNEINNLNYLIKSLPDRLALKEKVIQMNKKDIAISIHSISDYDAENQWFEVNFIDIETNNNNSEHRIKIRLKVPKNEAPYFKANYANFKFVSTRILDEDMINWKYTNINVTDGNISYSLKSIFVKLDKRVEYE